jgi:uncharacterized protein
MPTLESVRQYYPQADPVHGYDHIVRVYNLAEQLAHAEGADLEIVRAAALLHDAQGGAGESEGVERLGHQHTSAEFAGWVLAQEGWPVERIAQVQHCIRAHRFRDNREQPESLEAKVLFDADKLDAIGAIGVARAVAFAVKDGQPVYSPVSRRFEQSGDREPGEPHSSYHEFIFKLRHLQKRLFTASARAVAMKRHCFMDEFYKRLAAEIQGEL